jgi:hypothetical protein
MEDTDMATSEVISYLVSGASIVVAIWQTIKNINLKKYIRTEAMEIYSDTGILLGSAQTCLQGLQGGHNNLAVQDAGKVEGMAQALFMRSVKNIHHRFDFTRKDVDEWINKNKILAYHRDAFLKYAEK